GEPAGLCFSEREKRGHRVADDAIQDESAPGLLRADDPLRSETAISRHARKVKYRDLFLIVIDVEEFRLQRLRQPNTLPLAVPRHRPRHIAHGHLIFLQPTRPRLDMRGRVRRVRDWNAPGGKKRKQHRQAADDAEKPKYHI